MINLIFAIDPNGLIGKGNDLPWHYPEDLRYFKQRTMGKTVLMGLETFKSIIDRLGHPLPGRKSIVASLEPFSYPGVTVIDDVVAFFEDKNSYPIELFYTQAFPSLFFVSSKDESYLQKPLRGHFTKDDVLKSL